ncbi:MAG TPA: LCP family protein [Bacillota bacterium]|nr:LCP family protein [Bacillota bacterium]
MRKTRRKLKRKAPFVICCLVLLALLAGGCVLAKNILFPSVEGVFEPDSPQTGKRLNVLLLGVDARQGETAARADTIILASIDPKTKRMALLSIPRDTRVNIPGHGWDKINSATVYGGPELAAKVISDLVGMSVKYYVLTNFNGFKDIVDALGGVTLDVEQDMYHWDDEDGGIYEINLKKGVQRLDGDKALQYVRYRDYMMGDIDRTKHQQKFLVALAGEILQPGTIPKLPRLIPEINRYVKTNLTLSDMYTLASAARNLEDANIVTQTLPGRPLDIDGGSYWGVDPAEARQMMARLLNGETVSNVVLTTPLSGQYSGSSGTGTEKNAGQSQQSGAKSSGKGTEVNPAIPKTGASTATGSGRKDGKSSGGTGPTVVITPVDSGSDTDSDSGTGAETDGTPSGSGSQSGSGSSSGTTGNKGVNPAIPGSKTGTSTS